MISKFLLQAALSLIISLSFALEASCHADVFSDYSLSEAKEAAQKESKILLIDFTASWCPPCKLMESTTWIDENVKAWINQNAIAIQIDVDKGRPEAESLKIRAMPTLVLFAPNSGSTEHDRKMGYMSASELLAWLEGVKSGKSKEELEKERLKSAADQNAIWMHLTKAKELRSTGKNSEALEEYLWLWNNIGTADPNLAMIKTSLLPHEIKELLKSSPPARAKFSALRDTASKSEDKQEWIILNGILDDNERTLAWFDKIKNDPKQKDVIKKNTGYLERILFNATRWSDAAEYLYRDPIAKINEFYKRAQKMKKSDPHTEVAKDFDPFPSMVILLYGAYVGANREEEATKIENECLKLDDTTIMRETLSNMANSIRKARDAKKK